LEDVTPKNSQLVRSPVSGKNPADAEVVQFEVVTEKSTKLVSLSFTVTRAG
jgi:hypothetical protein